MAVDASNGKPLWQFPTNTGWRASPMTYQFAGKQHVAIESGSNIIVFGLVNLEELIMKNMILAAAVMVGLVGGGRWRPPSEARRHRLQRRRRLPSGSLTPIPQRRGRHPPCTMARARCRSSRCSRRWTRHESLVPASRHHSAQDRHRPSFPTTSAKRCYRAGWRSAVHDRWPHVGVKRTRRRTGADGALARRLQPGRHAVQWRTSTWRRAKASTMAFNLGDSRASATWDPIPVS